MAFEDVAEVYYPTENCRFAAYIARRLCDWKTELHCGEDVDLIHWNAGLWDSLILPDGMHHTSIIVYKEYIERICKMIKILFPNAKMIFATSTPVQEELFLTTEFRRYNKDMEEYNQAAVEIIKRYGGEINDLYMLAKESPVEYHSDRTHYYTKEGTKMLTDQVIDCIEKSINIKAKHLNYDELFKKEEDVLGL